MIRTRVLPLVLAAVAATAIAGCGGGGGSSASLAGFATPGSLIFVEGKLRPSGELKSNADSVAEAIAGESLGDLIVSKLEKSAKDDGEPFDFAKEVEPWLGEEASVAFTKVEEGNPSDPVVAIETTDAEATQDFVDARAQQGSDPYEDSSYDGIDFKVGGSDENAIGVIDDFLVIAEGKAGFEAAVDASQGESLADEAQFSDAISAASDGSLADIYVDLGGLIEASEDGTIDPQALEIFKSAGIEPSKATVVASVIPGSDQVLVDISSELGDEEAPSGDASDLIGSLPADSFAAVGASGFAGQVREAIDKLDQEGVSGQVPPNQLKDTLKAMGIDLNKIAASLEEGAVFAEGRTENSLGGALVLTSDSDEAAKTVANLGVLLRNTGSPGVTAVTSNGVSGFSFRSSELGEKPLVVVSKSGRVAIGYGLAPALAGLNAGSGETLSEVASYQAAVSALGGTPISAFVDGPGALRLAEALVPHSDTGFKEAKPYLKNIEYIAAGSAASDGVATSKLIVGLEK